MNKDDVKRILMSMRTTENAVRVNYLLGQIDMMTDEQIKTEVEKAGGTEDGVRAVLTSRIGNTSREEEPDVPLNKYITYRMTGDCIHLHLPHQLKDVMQKLGPRKTMDLVNVYLLDALERVRQLKNNGFHKFIDKKNIYMISPILVKRELDELADVDFKTALYTKKQLQDPSFVAATPEAQLATHIFGNKTNVGTAVISLDILNTPEWQAKRKAKLEDLKGRGATMDVEGVAIE